MYVDVRLLNSLNIRITRGDSAATYLKFRCKTWAKIRLRMSGWLEDRILTFQETLIFDEFGHAIFEIVLRHSLSFGLPVECREKPVEIVLNFFTMSDKFFSIPKPFSVFKGIYTRMSSSSISRVCALEASMSD